MWTNLLGQSQRRLWQVKRSAENMSTSGGDTYRMRKTRAAINRCRGQRGRATWGVQKTRGAWAKRRSRQRQRGHEGAIAASSPSAMAPCWMRETPVRRHKRAVRKRATHLTILAMENTRHPDVSATECPKHRVNLMRPGLLSDKVDASRAERMRAAFSSCA